MAFLKSIRKCLSSFHAYLYKSDWIILAAIIRWIYDLLLPDDRKAEKEEWIFERVVLDLKINIMQQYQIYLQENIASLEYFPCSESLIDSDTTEVEEESNDALAECKSKLQSVSERLVLLKLSRCLMSLSHSKSAPIFKLRYDMESRKWHEKYRQLCVLNGGCCERGCGCCDKPRQTITGEEGSVNASLSHCTVACPCCIRRRRFLIPSLEYLALTKPTAGRAVWAFQWMMNPKGL